MKYGLLSFADMSLLIIMLPMCLPQHLFCADVMNASAAPDRPSPGAQFANWLSTLFTALLKGPSRGAFHALGAQALSVNELPATRAYWDQRTIIVMLTLSGADKHNANGSD